VELISTVEVKSEEEKKKMKFGWRKKGDERATSSAKAAKSKTHQIQHLTSIRCMIL